MGRGKRRGDARAPARALTQERAKSQPSQRRWTDEQLREAVAASESLKETAAALGLSDGGGGYQRAKRLIQEMGLDTSHWSHKRGRKPRWSDDDLRKVVREAASLDEAAKLLGVNGGNSWRSVKRRVDELALDTSHWYEGPITTRAHDANRLKLSVEEMFVIDSPVSPQALKQRLRELQLLPYACHVCDLTQWKEGPLSLQIDHINGRNWDWSIDNLRWLCPNCHSQTETWGRNIDLSKQVKRRRLEDTGSGRYLALAAGGLKGHRLRPRKWTPEQLAEAVKLSTNLSQVCQHLGLRSIDDNYILLAEWINHLGLDVGHWLYGRRKPIEDLVTRGHLRRRLIEEGILEEKCYDCGIGEWLNRPLLVQLHHKNGRGKDNSLRNLTFLCPNCHSQTDSFAGRNAGRQ